MDGDGNKQTRMEPNVPIIYPHMTAKFPLKVEKRIIVKACRTQMWYLCAVLLPTGRRKFGRVIVKKGLLLTVAERLASGRRLTHDQAVLLASVRSAILEYGDESDDAQAIDMEAISL